MKTLPPKWKLCSRKGKFAPMSPSGVVFEAVAPGKWHGGTRAEALHCAWEIHLQTKADAKRNAEWKVVK